MNTDKITKRLRTLISDFKREARRSHVRLGSTPERAAGMCGVLSDSFTAFARSRGLSVCELIVIGPIVPTRRIVNKISMLVPVMAHCLSWLPRYDVGVDFTARQFWPYCNHPHIWTRKELKAHWRHIYE
jgi:hypothetical protein